MHIISHRGFWLTEDEKNSRTAFARSLSAGFGIETDVRDFNDDLVISHDIARGAPMTLEQYLDLLNGHEASNLIQAINIKADGMAARLAKMMGRCSQPWFVFDMSVPDMMQHIKAGNPVFARMSELEPFQLGLVGRIKGIWLDAFDATWYSMDTIRSIRAVGLEVCVVSPELHGRQDHLDLWKALADFKHDDGVILCTDLPYEAAKTLGLAAREGVGFRRA